MEFLTAKPCFICFAPIDLKNADFYIRDGWTTTGVTNTDTEPLGETVIALTGCSANVPVGSTVHFANDSTDTEYVVESRVTAGGTSAIFQIDLDGATGGTFTLTYAGQTTNAIAFDAAYALIQLELEALDGIGNGDVLVEVGTGAYDIDITFQDDLASTVISITTFTFNGASLTGGSAGDTMDLTTPGVVDDTTTSITLTEGLEAAVSSGGAVTFTGNRLEIRIGEGNLTYTTATPREYIKNRGKVGTANGGSVRNGEDETLKLSFEFMWEWITGVSGSGTPTIEDALTHEGEASAWVTTSSDTCEPQDCVDIEIHYDPGCGSNTEKIVFPEFRHDELVHDIDASSISCTGQCNVTRPVVTRT